MLAYFRREWGLRMAAIDVLLQSNPHLETRINFTRDNCRRFPFMFGIPVGALFLLDARSAATWQDVCRYYPMWGYISWRYRHDKEQRHYGYILHVYAAHLGRQRMLVMLQGHPIMKYL